ncbi:MAG: phosphomethylpyrimidine synthase ThiC, partial [Betaproteobacteria bacterium]
MNANPKFIAATAAVDDAAIVPLPRSRKVYVTGSRPDLRVPMREIAQSDTPSAFGAESNPPLSVYATSGPDTDPQAPSDRRAGRAPRRAGWRDERGEAVG